MPAYIITGGSKGLGAELARQLLKQGAAVHCVSRGESESLRQEALRMKGAYTFHAFDLAQTDGLDSLMERILSQIDHADRITLINNAGQLAPMTFIGRADQEDLQRSLQVNLIAPALLTNSFIRQTQALPVVKRVVQISSGAGKKPYPGWGAYCTAKAGIDMLTRCIGVEQANQPYPVEVISVAPGVVDTEMQREIRAASEEDFPQQSRFVELHTQGELQSPEATAAQLLELLQGGAFDQGEIADLRTKNMAPK
ncbi:(S)-benzoin forming benzil reductase [Paenibacillus aceris]|uniref:Benzil reductase ((S)-benzoin forming) n=1 Tax=Paenibacillus aceris TaxID=869555 RepID=A0ABS4IA29_9BACL|nr:(S)-benzoin forming benzil reductase [Paenibacillus aceris]MBP1967346.1 benzil reductase ((S)-benzoin forming) [Paenibacillus aceris]NHW38073.1 (S)-benzoin forming benzil reductase [Paenibacillus aceris]